MGSLRRKSITKPLPANAEIVTQRGERRARWKGPNGKSRTARIVEGKDGELRIAVESKWFAKYRDGEGFLREVATGCNDEQAARAVLAKLERRAELVRGEIISAVEDAVADHRATPISTHVSSYLEHLKAGDRSGVHLSECKRQIERLVRELHWRTLGDLQAESVERWLVLQTEEGMSARTRNSYVQSLRSFGNWCVRRGRLVTNPIAAIERADQRSDRRKVRRALTPAELAKLLSVAADRPLAEYGRATLRTERSEDKRKRSGWNYADLSLESLQQAKERARERLSANPDLVARLERLGRERALVYKTLVLTGLRRKELASLTVGQVHLDDDFPCLELGAADEKNRQGSSIPLRDDLVADLREWLKTLADDRPTLSLDRAVAKLPASMPLFDVPKGLVKILDRDLKLAGIAKRDERGRSLDVHAMRTTFSTLLSAGGVAPRTAQAALRHGDVRLTMETYTDPKLLDVRGALNALPALPLDGSTDPRSEFLQATGTDSPSAAPSPKKLASLLAPASDISVQTEAFSGKEPAVDDSATNAPRNAETPEKAVIFGDFEGSNQTRPTGLEPATTGSTVRYSNQLSYGPSF